MEQELLIVDADAAEIIRLHQDTRTALQMALETALRIGELLCKHKARLGHGRFLPWVQTELPFSERTARNYMKLHERRTELKSANVADLVGAYRLLAEHKPQRQPPAKVVPAVQPKLEESAVWETDPLWIPRPGFALFWLSDHPGHEHVNITIAHASMRDDDAVYLIENAAYYVNISDTGFTGAVRPVPAAMIGSFLWCFLVQDRQCVSDFMQYAARLEYAAHPWKYNEEMYDSADAATAADTPAEAHKRAQAAGLKFDSRQATRAP